MRVGSSAISSLCLLGLALSCATDGTRAQDLPPIVFVSRDLPRVPDPRARTRAIELASSGRLLVLEESGDARVLLDRAAEGAPPDAPIDVADPDVSFDGERILFAGYSSGEQGWRIYEINADGSGFRQITRSDREIDLARYGEAAALLEGYDDVDPCYLPDGRICFVSTRYAGIATDGRLRATNLYVVDPDGADLHRITSERFGADTPAIEPSTGRIVYSRFWRTAPFTVDPAGNPPSAIVPGSPAYENIVVETSELPLRSIADEDFPGVNSWFLAGIRPDGTELAMWSGVRLDRELTQAYRPAFLPSGDALAVFLPVTPFIGYPRGYGLRRFSRGPAPPLALGGPQVFPRRFGLPPLLDFYYASAEGLPDGRIVVTAVPASDAGRNYAIYVQENAEESPQPTLVYDEPGTMELDAIPLLARPRPPVLPDGAVDRMLDDAPRTGEEAFETGGSFRFLSQNIFFNAPVDSPIVSAPPLGEPLTIEFYLNSQRTSPIGGDEPILLDRKEIPPSGRIDASAPGGVPLFEVLRRRDGSIAMGRDGQIFHVAGSNFGRSGTTVRCVGCHAGHTQIEIPEDPSWTNLAPSAQVTASSRRTHGRLNQRDFSELNLIDRRTGSPDAEWSATQGAELSTIVLRWSMALYAREVVVYGTSSGEGTVGVRDQVVRGLSVTTLRSGAEQQNVSVEDEIDPRGTSIPLDPDLELDTITITVPSASVTGVYEGREGTALAEIEVISRATGDPARAFTPGDANCDAGVNLSDPVTILNVLFGGLGPFCCEAAGDADASGRVDLTDAVTLLGFLFQNGPGPEGVFFGVCGPAPVTSLECERSGCP